MSKIDVSIEKRQKCDEQVWALNSTYLLKINRIVLFARVAMITSAQCRAARGLLDWTQQKLADQARVGLVTIRQLEAGTANPRRATLEVIERAFERAGVELIGGDGGGAGVRLRK